MTNAITSTPPGSQPPTITDGRSAAQEFRDKWDWLHIGIFFWGMVFLLTLVPTVLYAWYYRMLLANHYVYSHQAQITLAFSVIDLVLPAALLVGGSALLDRTVWGTDERSRMWVVGRLALALGLLAAVAGFALAFTARIYQAFLPAPSITYDFGAQLRTLGAGWLLVGIENGLVLGVALAFVFRSLSQRTGRAWRIGLLGAALVAGCALGISNHLDTLLVWATTAWMVYVRTDHGTLACTGGSGAGCFTGEALTWVVAGALPLLLALPLGALVGAALPHPNGAREAREAPAPEATGGDAGAEPQPQNTQGRHWFWRALGRAAGSFAAGLLVTAAWVYALVQAFITAGRTTGTTLLVLVAIQLLPFGILALIGAIRLARLPREQRPSARGIVALAIVVVLGVAPNLLPAAFLLPIGAPSAPNAVTFVGIGFSYTLSLGALLALCWWPAAGAGMRRVLTTALAGWLGFALPLLLVTGATFYQYATYSPSQTSCQRLGCGALQFLVTMEVIEVGLIAACVGLPFTLFGAWMASWLLQRGTLSRARDAIA